MHGHPTLPRVALLLPLALPTGGRADAPATIETSHATPAGTMFTLPAGWTIEQKGDVTIVGPPETDTHLAILDMKGMAPDSAVASAWRTYQPAFKRPLKLSLPQAPRDGWEERRGYQYETSPNERAVVQAVAWRAGDTWTVVLIDGTEPTIEKRGGPLGVVIQSLRPKGYARESFKGKQAHSLDTQRLQVLKDFVAHGMKLLDTQGVGLAFIDGGKTVWAGGIGVRQMGKPDRLTRTPCSSRRRTRRRSPRCSSPSSPTRTSCAGTSR
jgi:hypothetical protein